MESDIQQPIVTHPISSEFWWQETLESAHGRKVGFSYQFSSLYMVKTDNHFHDVTSHGLITCRKRLIRFGFHVKTTC